MTDTQWKEHYKKEVLKFMEYLLDNSNEDYILVKTSTRTNKEGYVNPSSDNDDIFAYIPAFSLNGVPISSKTREDPYNRIADIFQEKYIQWRDNV